MHASIVTTIPLELVVTRLFCIIKLVVVGSEVRLNLLALHGASTFVARPIRREYVWQFWPRKENFKNTLCLNQSSLNNFFPVFFKHTWCVLIQPYLMNIHDSFAMHLFTRHSFGSCLSYISLTTAKMSKLIRDSKQTRRHYFYLLLLFSVNRWPAE